MKKGFTLIELLAVIVILAIIALIAVPIIINIIEDAKNSGDEQSVELYLDAVKSTLTKKQLSNPSFNPDKCIIQDNNSLDCYKNTNKIETIQVDIKGHTPEKGIIEIEDNKYIYKNILLNGKYYYERGILVEDGDNNNKISIGDKYTYKVNDADKFYFYVLSLNEDNTVNLIMNSNICEDGSLATYDKTCFCNWNSALGNVNSEGPTLAMANVYKATKNWTNVPNMNLYYNDEQDSIDGNYIVNTYHYGYDEMVIIDGKGIIKSKSGLSQPIELQNNMPIKARLAKFSEIAATGCEMKMTYNEEQVRGTCPIWLVENMQFDPDIYPQKKAQENILAYYTLSSKIHGSNTVHEVHYRAMLTQASARSANVGIRPVITVPTSDLAS